MDDWKKDDCIELLFDIRDGRMNLVNIIFFFKILFSP